MRGRVQDAAPEAELEGGDRAGTDVAFRTFVAARWVALTRYAFLLTGDHHIAEDVVQTALASCWPKWSQIQRDSPEPYVRAAIANAAASRGRRKRLPESSFEDLQERAPHLLAGSATAGDLADDHAARVGMWLALQDLAPRRRAVVVLRLWEDRSEAETAQALGISAGAVKSQLSKGLRQLRENPHTRTYFDSQGER